jgi:membrane protein YdbS with pleckstrin-like domain
MKANLSKKVSKEAKVINGVWKTVIICGAVALAIGAWIHNPWHLGTAAIIFALGLESDIVKKDRNEIC